MNKHQAQYLLKHASSLQKEAVNPAAALKGAKHLFKGLGRYLGLYGDEVAAVAKNSNPSSTGKKWLKGTADTALDAGSNKLTEVAAQEYQHRQKQLTQLQQSFPQQQQVAQQSPPQQQQVPWYDDYPDDNT